jgi:hypothetical protein
MAKKQEPKLKKEEAKFDEARRHYQTVAAIMAGGILGAIAADAGGNVPDKNLIRNTLMTCWDVAEETFR